MLLVSFLLSNVSVCAIMINKCGSGMPKCCNKKFADDSSYPEKMGRSCCCEIRESSRQPAEITLTVNEGNQKISDYALNTNPNYYFGITENVKYNTRVLSTHSPPEQDIYLLNSNFRI
ncbi:MAG: hypothetical protein ABI462_02330 [Ignavibacteria bacterium]